MDIKNLLFQKQYETIYFVNSMVPDQPESLVNREYPVKLASEESIRVHFVLNARCELLIRNQK